MTKIVIVGEAYYSDLRPDQGLPPGFPGSPSHPWVPPGSGGVPSHPIVIPGAPPGQPGSPTHPIYVPIYPDQGLPPGSPGSPSHPIYNPAYPDQGLPGVPPGFWGGVAPPYPDQGLPSEPPAGGNPVPEDVYTPAPIPEELASQYIASVYNPKTMTWTTKSYPPR